LKNGVEIYGGFPSGGGDGTMASRDPWRYTTILSGNIGNQSLTTDNCYHVVTGSGTGLSTILDGFQITGGYADGSSLNNQGGGMFNATGSPTLRNVVFLRNHANQFGGAMENSNSSPALQNVVFYGNKSSDAGGAIDNYNNSDPSINNALFVGNTAVTNGGAIHNESSSSPVLRNVTMVSNEAGTAGGGIFNVGSSGTTAANSILWSNTPDQITLAATGSASIFYSTAQGGCPASVTCDNVLSTDPQFLMEASPGTSLVEGVGSSTWGDDDDFYGDLRLERSSPALDSGNNAMVQPGITTDLMGNPRFANAPDSAAVLEALYIVDRGAYEAPPMPIYVDQSAAGANNGYNWTDAFTDLQDAFTWGLSGPTEIWVAEGSYLPGNLRTSTFQLLDEMVVYGGFPAGGGDGTFAARDWEQYHTVLSGELGIAAPTDNVYHVVTASGVTPSAVLDGFEVSKGYAYGPSSDQRIGAGLYAPEGNPHLNQLGFKDNYAEDGGGGAYFSDSAATLSHITFFGNDTEGDGGGMALKNGSAFVLSDSVFGFNSADFSGGGLFVLDGQVTIYNTGFFLNWADQGGGIYAGKTDADLERVSFDLNGAEIGGGMWVGLSSVTLSNSVFSINTANDDGGGLFSADDGTLTLNNVTFSGNHADDTAGGIGLESSSVANTNNTILWGNFAPGGGDQFHIDGTSSLDSSYDLIEGGCPSTGATCDHLIASDPLFVADPGPGDDGIWGGLDDDSGDLRLQKTSPAIDAGDNTVWAAATWDVERNPRQVDVASVTDTGHGTAPIVDIGAYENPPDVIYVDQTASGAYSGLSWTDAYTDVQDALAWGMSGPFDIWVAQGTYTPGAQRDDTFELINNVALYGGFPTGGGDGSFDARHWRAYPTLLSGDIGVQEDSSDNCYNVVKGFYNDYSTIIDGFTITAGRANSGTVTRGGGMYLTNSIPTIRNVIFQGNDALYGGGLYNSFSSPTLFNVEFHGNTAGHGGAIYNRGSDPMMINLDISGNSASDGGAGMENEESDPTLVNVTIAYNQGTNLDSWGGGIYNWLNSSPNLINTIVWGNDATDDAQISNDVGSLPSIQYSLVQGSGGSGAGWDVDLGSDGGGNLDSDPLFISISDPGTDGDWGTPDDDYGDLGLQPDSPAIDAGTNAEVPGGVTIDLAGNSRFVDIASVPDTGEGSAPIIDLGAYEARIYFLYLPLILR
jgi:hypothetical protein